MMQPKARKTLQIYYTLNLVVSVISLNFLRKGASVDLGTRFDFIF